MPTTTERPPRQITGRIQSQFRDLPGMRLTEAQIQRLCHLSKDECHTALDELINRGELSRDPNGRYRARIV